MSFWMLFDFFGKELFSLNVLCQMQNIVTQLCLIILDCDFG